MGFNNLTKMRQELLDAGISEATHWDEARLIHEYNITFLANNWEHREESKQYRPKGIRNPNGRFPS